MGGIQRLFLRITPLIMLICFICLGITHIFQQQNQPSITYLTTETITINDNNTETTDDDITITNYNFDFSSYRQNINVNFLKRSIEKVIDLQTYNNNINTFKLIWQDGYNIGDVSQTLMNGILLAINTLILPINIVLVPIRITAGILLTAFSIIGININNQTIIITSLNTIIDQLAIPLIQPTYQKGNSEYNGTTWIWNTTINNQAQSNTWNIVDVNFTTEGGGIYIQFISAKQNGNTLMYYVDRDNNQILVYDSSNNGWQYATSQKITISSNNTLDDTNFEKLKLYLTNWATKL